MKKYYYALLFSASLLIATAFRANDAARLGGPAQAIKTQYVEDLQDFASATKDFSKAVAAFGPTEQNVAALREQYFQLRKQYKQIEYLMDYLDPEFVEDYINGAPLLSLERKTTSIVVLEPAGFQIIEELLYGENPYQEREKISSLAKDMAHKTEQVRVFQSQMPLTDRQVFEAARRHMIRVFTWGVSGFDSPAGHSLHDVRHSLARVATDFALYYPLISTKNRELATQIDQHFGKAIQFVEKNNDFDTFDRAAFLRLHIDPLYGLLLDAHLQTGIETYYETEALDKKHSVNYYAKSLFANNLLHKDYYMNAAREVVYSKRVIELGRLLFFDPILSSNNERACASCHVPQKAFTDGRAKSLGKDFEGTVQRNSPTLINAVFADRFFYDLRSQDLEGQIDHVVADHKEFATNFIAIFEKLEKSEEYKQLFREAFPELQDYETINKFSVSASIGAYVASLSSFNSPFDRYMRKETDQIGQGVVNGFNLFMGKAACGTCHFAPTFSGLVPPLYQESESEVLGVPENPRAKQLKIDTDRGRTMGILRDQSDIYENAFKTTTARNVALTAPYMHNGAYQTLEEVLDFYNQGGGHGLGLDVPNQTLPTDPLGLTDQEQRDIISFLRSLTDTTGLTSAPKQLPTFANQPAWNQRVVGGKY